MTLSEWPECENSKIKNGFQAISMMVWIFISHSNRILHATSMARNSKRLKTAFIAIMLFPKRP